MKETFKLEKSDNQSSYKNRFFPDVAFSSTVNFQLKNAALSYLLLLFVQIFKEKK